MKEVKIDLAGLSVMLGIPAGRDLHPYTNKSEIATFRLLERVGVPGQLGMIAGSSIVQWARDEVVDVFLKSSANRLFWIDSDMCWEPEDFMRLLAFSQLYPVICAAYPAKRDPPTFYLYRDEAVPLQRNEHGLLEVWGAGLGFTCVQREVIEKLAAKAPRVWDEISQREMAEIFRVGSIEKDGKRYRRGEDIAFFNDVRELGYKVWLDPEVSLGHIGMKKYEGSIKDALQLQA